MEEESRDLKDITNTIPNDEKTAKEEDEQHDHSEDGADAEAEGEAPAELGSAGSLIRWRRVPGIGPPPTPPPLPMKAKLHGLHQPKPRGRRSECFASDESPPPSESPTGQKSTPLRSAREDVLRVPWP